MKDSLSSIGNITTGLENKGIDHLAEARAKYQDKQHAKALVGFESMLLNEMFKTMWKSIEKTDFLGGDSNEQDIYRDMFNQAVADEASKGRGIGIKENLEKFIQREEDKEKSEA